MKKNEIMNSLVLAIQYMLAIFFSIMLVPVLINSVCGDNVITIPVTIFATGLGTIIYVVCTKGKIPNYLTSSLTFVVPIISIFALRGTAGVFTSIMAVGITYIIFAIIIKILGKKILSYIFTPTIVGSTLIVIGMALVPNAISYTSLQAPSIEIKKLIITGVTFLTIVVLSNSNKKILSQTSILIGIILGYLTALILGEVDLSIIKGSEWIKIPKFILPTIDYQISYRGIIMILPVALFSIVHHISMHKSLEVNTNNQLPAHKTLFAHGLANIFSGFIGGPALEVSSEYVGATNITKKVNILSVILAAIFFMILSCCNKFILILNTIPSPVIGSVMLILYGSIIVSGIKILSKENLSDSKTLIIIGAMLTIGLGGTSLSYTRSDITVALNSMSAAFVTGIILNIILKAKIISNDKPLYQEKQMKLEFEYDDNYYEEGADVFEEIIDIPVKEKIAKKTDKYKKTKKK